MGKKWFFKRGNVRVSWKYAPEWAMLFSVDRSGHGDWWGEQPLLEQDSWVYNEYRGRAPAGFVGFECDDWKTLIFERLQEPQKPHKPLVTAEEWAAIRLLLPGARWVAKSKSGFVHAYDTEPHLCYSGWSYPQEVLYLKNLNARFAAIDWQDSLVEYPDDSDESHKC